MPNNQSTIEMSWLGSKIRNPSSILGAKRTRGTLLIACILMFGSLLLPVAELNRSSVNLGSGKVEVQHEILNTLEVLSFKIDELNSSREPDLFLSILEYISIVLMTVFQGIMPLILFRALQTDRRLVKCLLIIPVIGILRSIWNFDSSFRNPMPPLNVSADLVWIVGIFTSLLGILQIPVRSHELAEPMNGTSEKP